MKPCEDGLLGLRIPVEAMLVPCCPFPGELREAGRAGVDDTLTMMKENISLFQSVLINEK